MILKAAWKAMSMRPWPAAAWPTVCQQVELKRQIEATTAEILPQISQNGQFQRQFFQAISDEVGFEIVREILRLQSGKISLSRQVWDFLYKIRTFRPHTKTQIPGGKEVKFWKEFFEF